ncbi:MAG: N-6 DNA methylase, partial [Pyrinomonadaceae bacterium]
DQLTRQFWVTKQDVRAHKYDLSASRYRQIEADETFYEEPNVTLERLMNLESVMQTETNELQQIIA